MAETPGIAAIFPGQGSQSVGMGRDLYERYPLARELFDRAAGVLGFDLARLCFEGPEEELAQTRVTQPAIFVHSLVVFRLLEQRGFAPALAAGHSLGEYSALAAAGFFSFEEGLALVARRGELMQQAGAAAPGTMAAVIGLEDSRVEELCRAAGSLVVPANFNAPGQVVISGAPAGVEQVMQAAKAAGARLVQQLKVSGAFHSPLVAAAAEGMRRRLAEAVIEPGRIPVVANVTADFVTAPEAVRELLVRQITSPVRWTESFRRMLAAGATGFVEVGPGMSWPDWPVGSSARPR